MMPMHFSTIDAHVAGGAVRLVTAGLPRLDGRSLQERSDSVAQMLGAGLIGLSREPRGHEGTVGAMLAEPDRPDADAGILFFAHGPIARAATACLVPRHWPGVARLLTAPTRRLRHAGGRYGARRRLDSLSRTYQTARVSGNRPRNLPAIGARRSRQCGRRVVANVDAEAAACRRPRGWPSCSEAAEVARALEGDHVGGWCSSASHPSGVDVRSATVRGWRHRALPGGARPSRSPPSCSLWALAMDASVHRGLFGSTLDATERARRWRERPGVRGEVTGEVWPTGDHQFSPRRDPTSQPRIWIACCEL
jgi:hypothetical protein